MRRFVTSLCIIVLYLMLFTFPVSAEEAQRKFQRIENIPSDKAVIYFFRGDRNDLIDYEPTEEPLQLGTSDPIVIEQENGALKMELLASSHKKVLINPGTYRFKATQAVVKITVEKGKEYCIRGLLAKELIMAAKTEGLEKVPLDYCMFHINNTLEMP